MLDTREQTIAAYSISCIRRASLGGSEAAERRCGESANIGVSRSWPLVADESGPILVPRYLSTGCGNGGSATQSAACQL